MMRDYDRILHILGAIDDALESTDGITKADFLENKDKRAAAERYVMIIGPAWKHTFESRISAKWRSSSAISPSIWTLWSCITREIM